MKLEKKIEVQTTSYIEDGNLCVGIRSEEPFTVECQVEHYFTYSPIARSFDDGDGYHVVYLHYPPTSVVTNKDGSVYVNDEQLNLRRTGQ